MGKLPNITAFVIFFFSLISSHYFRIEELEEALRESVSITAERELHVAQQKQMNQQLSLQVSYCLLAATCLQFKSFYSGINLAFDVNVLENFVLLNTFEFLL